VTVEITAVFSRERRAEVGEALRVQSAVGLFILFDTQKPECRSGIAQSFFIARLGQKKS